MKLFVLIAPLFLAALAFADDDKIEEEGDVLVLNEKNFAKAIEDNEHILVEFYAPWCGHCKQLAPEYEKAAKKLKESGSKIRLAKVDATIEKKLGDDHGVKGFPTLKFFKSKTPKDYNGPREADGIVSWLEKKTGPPAKTVSTVEEVEKVTEDKEVVVVGFFKDTKEDGEAKEFFKAADANDAIPFLITSDKDVWSKYDIKETGKIIVLKKFDEGRNDYDGKLDSEEINKFVMSNSLPMINEFTQETAPKLFSTDVKVHFLLLANKKDDGYDKLVDAIRPAAKKSKGKMIFVTLDAGTEENKQILDFFGVKEEECPTYVIYEMEKSANYRSEGKVEEAKVSKFVQDFHDGKLKRHLKSEKLPEDWDKEPVKVLVSSNFKEVALDKTKDVFVEFYAPWCGHCKAIAPKWDKLAEHFKDNKDVVIAKMDSTANEIEEVTVEGFPTLKLFKKETNEIVDYNGPRETEDMIKFVETGEASDEGDEGGDDDDEELEDDDEDEAKHIEL